MAPTCEQNITHLTVQFSNLLMSSCLSTEISKILIICFNSSVSWLFVTLSFATGVFNSLQMQYFEVVWHMLIRRVESSRL